MSVTRGAVLHMGVHCALYMYALCRVLHCAYDIKICIIIYRVSIYMQLYAILYDCLLLGIYWHIAANVMLSVMVGDL